MKRKILFAIVVLVTALTFFGLGWFLNKPEEHSEAKDVEEEEPKSTLDSLMDAEYPEYMVYGMHEEKDYQRQIVDHQYRFRFRIIGGCTVDGMTRVRAEMNNKKTDSIMSLRYGREWLKKFEYSVDSLYALDSISIEIARKDKRIQKIETLVENDREKHGAHVLPAFHCFPTPDKDIKMIDLTGERFVKGDMQYMNILRAAVDIKRKRVINLDTISF